MNLNSNNENVALLGLLQSESYFRFNIEQYAVLQVSNYECKTFTYI